MRLFASVVIALIVFMFDRALYQSDWFYQGALNFSKDGLDAHRWSSPWTWARLTLRLGISIVLASILSLFVELALFGDSITEKIKSDYLAANSPIFEKINNREAEVDAEITNAQNYVKAIEEAYDREFGSQNQAPLDPIGQSAINELRTQLALLDRDIAQKTDQIKSLREQIRKNQEDMAAEDLGVRRRPEHTGRRGQGENYKFAREQKILNERELSRLRKEIGENEKQREQLTSKEKLLVTENLARNTHERETRRAELQAQITERRALLISLQGSRLAKIEQFRNAALSAPDFRKFRDDPLSRMTAYSQLKDDPKDGATITHISWMTKALIIFLEIVPVLAKIIFSPPSVYAALIQAQVKRSSDEARQTVDQIYVEKETELERKKEQLVDAQRKRWMNEQHGSWWKNYVSGLMNRSQAAKGEPKLHVVSEPANKVAG